jgi:phosphoserine aminotransferase
VKKASLLYDTIAGSNGFYFSPVEDNVRSKMNVPFTIPRCDNAAAVVAFACVCGF